MESFLEFFLEYRHNLKTGITPKQGMEAPTIAPSNKKGNNINIDPLSRKHPGLAAPYKPIVTPGIYPADSDVLSKVGVNFDTLQSKGRIENFNNSGNDCILINSPSGPMIKIQKRIQSQPN